MLWKCGHELEYNVLNGVVIEEGYVRVTMVVNTKTFG